LHGTAINTELKVEHSWFGFTSFCDKLVAT